MIKKRFLSALLVVCMLITTLPVEIFAENTERINPFSDIEKQDWFYEDALYARDNNLFSGTSENTFSPNDAMTRAMYVTVIGRMENIDTSMYSQSPTFTDVEKGSYYAPYVEWAKQMGITSGTGNGRFSPDELITRQDMATFTVRFFNAYGYKYPEASITTLPKDVANISSYAKDSVLKLWSAGLLKGNENGDFNPLNTATRAETAAFCSRIHRYENSKAEVPVNKTDDKKPSSGDESSEYDEIKYEVSFKTNGGGTIANRKLRSGTTMNNLPIPFKENSIFEGWCYDKELTLPISTSDKISNNITLYAKYLETAPLKEDETPNFASALDQNPDFTINVISAQVMTADEVKNAVTVKNLSSISQVDFITVTGAGTNFVISGTNGFEKGSTFKLTLDNENLYFEGLPDTVRDYNFTIAKEKALNFSLNSDIIYIPASEITSITGSANAPIALNNSDISEAEASGGTFTYSGSTEFKVGNKLSIYEGTRPDLRTVANDNDGDILYVKITGKSGNSYTYTSVETEDVLFTPDVLPVSNSADMDGNAYNNSIKVSTDLLDFSDDIYQNIGLDSQTTIDTGDFISFYDGVFGQNMQSVTYAKITSVRIDNGNYIIEFESVTKDEMLASMDAYDTNQISGEEMLKNVNKAAIEQSVEQQALKSGFAEEAAQYLASMALKTNSFTELSSAYDLTDIQIKTQDGDDLTDGEIMLMEGKKVEVDISKLQATLGTNLEYFDNYDGLRLTLEIGVEITIHASDKADIVIEITGRFEQEVRIDINVDGGAIWKWWGPFPYISEYEATANIDLFDYTGIGIEATIITAEAGDDDLTGMKNETINDIGKQLKDLMDAKDKYVGDGSGTVAEGLADKYKAMIENEDSEWVELFSEDIFKKEFNICLIIAVEVGVEFVVSANVNISLGMDFYYANAKRYTYTVAVFAGTVVSDVVDIVEEQYQFEFYVMGTLGLRAGIRAGVKVGLFTTKLASVGFTAEAGAYVRVWGYFYYQLRWTASQGKTTRSCGAMLFELGIYIEIKFEAQAFNGTFSYNPTLYDNEWPLWYAGMRENVQGFAYEQEEAPELSMKKTIQTADVPDSLFEMEYMDLKTGEMETKAFDDATNFKIEISNDAFTYNPQTNRLTVTPGGKSVQEGQMIVTWITAPLAFTSAPIERRINLYWDNYNDGYSIAFNSNGGSAVPIIIQRYGGNVKAPEAPVKQGYIFGGWYSDASLQKEYTIPAVMPDQDCSVYAKWVPATDTIYEVLHYTQDINGNYTLVDRDTLKGNTDSTVNVETKTYTGFASPALQQVAIKPDGSTKVNYYYKRNSYTVNFEPGDGGGETVTGKFKYGAAITAPKLSKEGYEFVGWDVPLAASMPAENVTYTALWAPKGDTPYRVEHYVMQTDGRYKFKEFQNKTDYTNQIILAGNLKKTAIEVENGITYSYAAVNGKTVENVAVVSDGSLVVKLYYDRSNHNITFRQKNGKGDIEKTFKYEEAITPPETPVSAGYTFGGWYTDEACTAALSSVMPANDVIAYAKWTANTNTPFKVEHYVMGTDGAYPLIPAYTDNLAGTTDVPCTLSELMKTEILAANGIIYHHAEVGVSTATEASISGDGSLVVKLYYERKAYNLTWEIGKGIAGGNYTQSGSIYYGSLVTPPVLSRAGYTYAWDKILSATMPAENITYTAVWTANTNTPYKVEHYVMGTDGKYSVIPVNTDNKTGTTDTLCTLSELMKTEILVVNGIIYHHAEVGGSTETEASIAGDGSLVVKLYYERKAYELTWGIGEGIASGNYTKSGSVYYGSPVTPPTLSRAGYTYVWDKTISATMPSENLTYTAVWTANTNTPYKVEHYQQNIADDNYTLKDRDSLTGTTDTTAKAQSKGYDYFTLNPNADGYLENGNISGNGQLLLKLFYDRDKFTVTFNAGDGILGADASQILKHGATVSTVDPTREGYGFAGWYTDENCSEDKRFSGTMPTENITLYAKWVAGQVSYKVEHYVMDTGGNYPTISNVSDNKTDIADSELILVGLKKASLEIINGIEFKEAKIGDNITTSASVYADGSLNVKMYYERMRYNLSWNLDGGTADNNFTEGDIYYGASITVPVNLAKAGYTYVWDNTPVVTMPANNLTYTAKWTANSYSVIFNANDGTDNKFSQNFVYDEEKTLTANSFNRTGYTFLGWSAVGVEKVYNDQESVKNLTAVQNGEVSLYAVWMPINYTITYITPYGIAENSSYTIEYATTLPTLSHPGYTFDGWYDNGAFNGTQVTKIDVGSTGNKLFYAKWTANTYSVIFNANDGTNNSVSQSFVYDVQKALTANSYERTGYTFTGWSATASGEKAYNDQEIVKNLTAVQNGEVLLYAVWMPISYTITYTTAYGIAENSSYTIEYATTLPALSHTGYTFDGWYDNVEFNGTAITKIDVGSTGNKLFYGKWSENTYTVSFNANGGNGEMASQGFSYTEEKPLNTNTFIRNGYTFLGWAASSQGTKLYDNSQSVKSLTASANGNINLYAVWLLDTYSISYALNSGTDNTNNPSQYDVTTGAITLEAPSRTGYTFSGWYTDETLTNKAADPAIAEGETGNKAFYAKWTANTYMVNFNSNGGSGTIMPQSFTYDEAAKALTANSFTLNGYTFNGWNTKADGSGVSYADKAAVRNLSVAANGIINLYARWMPVNYTISYSLYGGTNSLSNPASYTIEASTITFVNPAHSTEGNVFAGWYTDSGFNNEITEIPTGSTGNITLYAKWINCGKFTISNNGDNTFTITRTGGTDKAQTVYFRTMNGSAIGGTHFTHQENSIVIGEGQQSATITIAENGANAMTDNNAATAYALANREYFVNIYDVTGGATLGSTTTAKRIMINNSSYVVSEPDMTGYKMITYVTKSSGGQSGFQVYEDSGGGYNGTVNTGLNSNALNTSAYGSLSSYISATADGMKVQLKNFKGTDDGWRMYRYVLFNTSSGDVSFSASKDGGIPNLPSGTKVVLVYGISTDTNNTDSYSVGLPGANSTIAVTGTSKSVSIFASSWAGGQPSTDYALYGLNESIGISVGGYNSAAANSTWWFNSAELYTAPYDISGPDYIKMADMSNTSYKLGSKVTIALVFDEIVKSADGVTVLTNLSNTAFTLAGGVGTNVLYFEGTVTNTATSASVTTINNKTSIKDIFGNSAK